MGRTLRRADREMIRSGRSARKILNVRRNLSKGRYQATWKREFNAMAQGRSTQIISMIQWIQTSRLSIKNSLSVLPKGRLVG